MYKHCVYTLYNIQYTYTVNIHYAKVTNISCLKETMKKLPEINTFPSQKNDEISTFLIRPL